MPLAIPPHPRGNSSQSKSNINMYKLQLKHLNQLSQLHRDVKDST